jgi:hypothetical protein
MDLSIMGHHNVKEGGRGGRGRIFVLEIRPRLDPLPTLIQPLPRGRKLFKKKNRSVEEALVRIDVLSRRSREGEFLPPA